MGRRRIEERISALRVKEASIKEELFRQNKTFLAGMSQVSKFSIIGGVTVLGIYLIYQYFDYPKGNKKGGETTQSSSSLKISK